MNKQEVINVLEKYTYTNIGLSKTVIKAHVEAIAAIKELEGFKELGLTAEQLREVDKLYTEKCEELAKYKKLEEQGLLLQLPCECGDDVYIIPSKVNYDLNVLSKHEENNRVYHQRVECITLDRNGWYVECDKDVEYGTDRICIEQHFGITWFLTKEEAEAALKNY